MPCNCDYMNPSSFEIQLSQVACLLDEIRGVKNFKKYWGGYHPSVYGQANKELGDRLVSTLCSNLQNIDVSQLSLEMQMWWRDHKEADRTRILKEIKSKKREVSSLTDYESALLMKGNQ